MSGNVSGMTATRLGPETVAGLPCPEKSVEVGFARAVIEQDGGYRVGPLYLRTSDLESAVLAVRLEATVGPAKMAEARQLVAEEDDRRAKDAARQLIEDDPGRTDTGVFYRLLSGLRSLPDEPVSPSRGSGWNGSERDVA